MSFRAISNALPQLPTSLKPIAPYIQRAEELRSKDPVIAYWCTYYAAQLGLDQKSHEPGSQEYLLTLITLLEEMKRELGANDAIDHESAGAAYVENFAVKVFTLADNEDRQGRATRSTAKKFLAAANFLELLRVFEKSNNAQVNDEKVRYAKWKASDIARAFREGRKPTPGSASDVVAEGDPDSVFQLTATTAGATSVRHENRPPGGGTPPSLAADAYESRASPQKPGSGPGDLDFTPAGLGVHPGDWSIAAMPDSDVVGNTVASTKPGFGDGQDHWEGEDNIDDSRVKSEARRSDASPGSSNIFAPVNIPTKKVHFTPSITSGLSPADGSPQASPGFGTSPPSGSSTSAMQPFQLVEHSPESSGITDPTSAPLPDSSPSSSSLTSLEGSPPPRNVRDEGRTAASSRVSPPQGGNPHSYPSQPSSHLDPVHNLPLASPIRSIYAPKPPSPVQGFVQPPGMPATLELTPLLIAKAQKHCRYAISALEYEDAEQARKELHAALAVLGER
ncbi:hypothetical protein M0805_003415 [Coniferiporia weirii]|nr:hypothetical protein M0805_003415 [Coniferiporia weirii]